MLSTILVTADGSIWRGNLSTGEGEVVVPALGTIANGLDYDERSGYLYVAGGDSGEELQGVDVLVNLDRCPPGWQCSCWHMDREEKRF